PPSEEDRRLAIVLRSAAVCVAAPAARGNLLGAAGYSPTKRSTWPPNWKRIADRTFWANRSSPRELKRWNSAALKTGAGALSSIAAAIVQRPSPESLTWPANLLSCGSARSACAVRSSNQDD